jgi:hypothetical protein
MFEIVMVIDGIEYRYGADENRNRANEIAMAVREERNVETFVREI